MSAAAAGSDAVLERLTRLHPKKIDLKLDRISRLLAALGHPERRLAPVIHVAGTNGKGSVCAFFRAMLREAGLKVQVYSSPHLTRFHERIRLVDGLIREGELAALLVECERANDGQPITFFEITTAMAFLAFSRQRADATIIEVGLGGQFDATNVVERPHLSVVTPVGLDHAEFLGTDIAAIAAEKAGIVKPHVPLIVGPQDDRAREVIVARADTVSAPVSVFGQDFFVSQEQGRMVYQDQGGLLDLPLPRLAGRHQLENAAVAIAGLRAIGGAWADEDAIERGLGSVEWPARLQRLSRGPLVELAPEGAELWLDGGHNPHGAQAIARAMADFGERADKPLYLVAGMLTTKDAVGYFAAFKGLARHVVTVPIPGEAAAFGPGALYDAAREAELDAAPADDVEDAILQIAARSRAFGEEPAPRILICGSLYLAGLVLKENG